MHEQHEAFRAPTNADVSVWRYMDLPKFVSMLEAEALHFARSDCMSDRFEGSITKLDLEARRMVGATLMPAERFQEFLDGLAAFGEAERGFMYLNCWHMNEYESAAMWSLYQSGQPQGIAVRSTYRRLSKSITDRRHIYIGEVSYVDFDREQTPQGMLFYPYLHKRKSFEHEREIRAIRWTHEGDESEDGPQTAAARDPDNEPWPEGSTFKPGPVGPPVIEVKANLNNLVEAIYVSPEAAQWFSDLVRKVLLRYDRDWPVYQSDLDADPIF